MSCYRHGDMTGDHLTPRPAVKVAATDIQTRGACGILYGMLAQHMICCSFIYSMNAMMACVQCSTSLIMLLCNAVTAPCSTFSLKGRQKELL
jgi:hypothetical protein